MGFRTALQYLTVRVSEQEATKKRTNRHTDKHSDMTADTQKDIWGDE